jgi:hypothetical protein
VTDKPIVGDAPWVCIRNLPHAAGASYGSRTAAHTIAGEARQMWPQKLSGLLDAEGRVRHRPV